MDTLPGHVMDKVLFRIDHRSLAMMRCTNRSLQSHIDDPVFESEYSSRDRSGLLYIHAYGSSYLSYQHPHDAFRSVRIKDTLKESHVLGSCSGLLLLFIDDRLCVANPLTKKFRFLNHSKLMKRFTHRDVLSTEKRRQLGLAVNKIDRNTQSFKIVHMVEMRKANETRYRFQTYTANSCRYSETTLTCHSSDLDYRMKNHVCLDGSLHWLRNDGSIVAFNPETQQPRLIPIKFPQGLSTKWLFAAGDNSLTLISATEEVIHVYALENILTDPKWVLVKQIMNQVIDEKRLSYWNIEAYDGKCLILREDRQIKRGYGRCLPLESRPCCCLMSRVDRKKERAYYRLIHVYDLSANKWLVMDSVPSWSGKSRDTLLFTPSPSSVVELDEILACGDRRISSLSSIMALIDGSSSEKVEEQLRKRSTEHSFLYEQSTNKKRRVA